MGERNTEIDLAAASKGQFARKLASQLAAFVAERCAFDDVHDIARVIYVEGEAGHG